jgi:hypothetical protein
MPPEPHTPKKNRGAILERWQQLVGAVLGALIVGVLGIVGATMAVGSNHGSLPTTPASTRSVNHSTLELRTASPTPTSPSKTIPLTFQNLRAGESVGPQINVILTGMVPSGNHLWIFIYSSGLYYVQSPPILQPPDYWSLAGVDLGGSQDAGQAYTICVVLANAQANGAIAKDLARTKSNTGTNVIPGNDGAKKIAQLTVIRTH